MTNSLTIPKELRSILIAAVSISITLGNVIATIANA